MDRVSNFDLPRAWILGLLIFVLALGAFAGGLGGPFLLDDIPLISRNAVTQDFGNAGRWLTGHLWDTTYGGASLSPPAAHYWRPLVQASYAFDWLWGRGQPAPFHATNLLLHGLASVLGFVTLRRWLHGSGGAFVGALVFALHPAKAESVAWISGRPDILVCVGLLLALTGLNRRLKHLPGGGALEWTGMAVAFTSKETAILLPFLAYVEWRAQDDWKAWSRRSGQEAMRALGPSVALTSLYVLLRIAFLPIVAKATPAPLGVHVVLVLETLGGYARLVAWPADLSLFGSVIDAARGVPFVLDWGLAVIGTSLLLASLGVAWWAVRRLPALAYGVLLFFVLLLPVSNVQLMPNLVLTSPRFLYVPLLAVALALGAATSRIARPDVTGIVRSLWYCSCAAAVVVLGSRSLVRSADFSSARTFWAYELAHGSGGEARGFFIANEMGARRPRAALGLLAQTFRSPSADELRFGRYLDSMTSYLRALLVVTPDVDTATLRAVEQFAEDMRESRPAVLDLPHIGLSVTQKAPKPGTKPWQFLAIEAECASRLGDDARGLASARRIIVECRTCDNVLEPAIVAAARGGDFGLARRGLAAFARIDERASQKVLVNVEAAENLATSVPNWRAQAVASTRFFATLGAWGRALDSARPAFDSQQPLDAETTLVLGQLALHAGDRERGLGMLRRFLSEAEAQAQVARIEREMMWIDAERPVDQPLPVF